MSLRESVDGLWANSSDDDLGQKFQANFRDDDLGQKFQIGWKPTPPPAGPVPFQIRACAQYKHDAFDMAMMPRVAEWAADIVRALHADAIVAVGHSGLPVAGAVSYITRVPVFAVRKPGEGQHCRGFQDMVSGVAPNGPAKRWVWLDDFIGSGYTLQQATKELMTSRLIATPVPVGLIQYNRFKRDEISEDTTGYRWRWMSTDFPGASIPLTIPSFGFRELDG